MAKSLPVGFLRPAWRNAVRDSGGDGSTAHRRAWEAATLLTLRDSMRSGDIWVEGSRQWRAIEDQLLPSALFAAMREANTVYLGRALDVVRHRGDVVPDEVLAHLAPLGWQHINLTGDYLWGADDRLAQDGFRPLRGISAHLPTAKAIAV